MEVEVAEHPADTTIRDNIVSPVITSSLVLKSDSSSFKVIHDDFSHIITSHKLKKC
jgi:hypothetical protein